MNVTTKIASPPGIGEAEWRLRCDLAALYRLAAHFKMTDFIYTHISAEIPGSDHHFLINDYGVMFHEMRASDLVKIDLNGNVLDSAAAGPRRVNQAGFTIHSAVHQARPDLMCVIHTHTAAGIAVSAQEQGLLPISQHAMKFYGCLSYHGYEGLALDLNERERLVADLGQNKAMILRNHGLLACGRTIPEAFHEIYFLERACQAQVAALSGGAKLIFPPREVCEHTAAQFRRDEANRMAHYEMAWQSALRLIEGGPSDYRS